MAALARAFYSLTRKLPAIKVVCVCFALLTCVSIVSVFTFVDLAKFTFCQNRSTNFTMSDSIVAPAPAAAAPSTTPKKEKKPKAASAAKPKKPKAPASHPPVADMVC